MADPARTARAMWTLFEPIHAVTYFAPEARGAFEEAGLRGFWRGYFAGREAEAEVAAGLLWQAIGELDFSGRVLAAANAALPVPDGEASGLARLWQATTLLREHRGDGHFAALAAADIDGCEAVALRCCMDLRREDLQPVRGWTDEAWDNALAGLTDRGWVRADGRLTSAGQAAHDAVENATDWAAARPWARLAPETTAEIVTVLTPLAQACASVVPYPSPIGVPAPG